VQQVHDLLLRERLLHQQTEENCVAEFTEVVEELCARVRILHDVLKGRLVIAKNAGRTVIVSG
jgi:hypothetical protein